MVICISDWPTATRIGNVTASHSHTHDYYFSDWPTAAHIRNVTESYLQLFVYRVSRMENSPCILKPVYSQFCSTKMYLYPAFHPNTLTD